MTAQELVAKVKNLPPASEAAVRLAGLLGQTELSNEDIVEVLKCDSVLTAKLLRVCNSPHVGLGEPVSSVAQAVLMLGHQEILRIVLTLGFGGALTGSHPACGGEANALWLHSLTTAKAAEIVAGSGLGLKFNPALAYTASLLHEIGKAIMDQTLSKDLQAKIRHCVRLNGVSRVELEKQMLGTDHAEVGACLLESWRVPEEIVEAVARHHQPDWELLPRLSTVAHVGNCLGHLAGSAPGWDGSEVRVADGVAEALGLTPQRFESMVASVKDSCRRVDPFIS